MKITLIGPPPHTVICGRVSQARLGLFGLAGHAGALHDVGFEVNLIATDMATMALGEIVQRVHDGYPDVVMIGHSGSGAVPDAVVVLCGMLRQAMGYLTIVYWGGDPSYASWEETLSKCPDMDVIVLGGGEETVLRLMQTLSRGEDLRTVEGIAFRKHGKVVGTPPAFMVRELDAYWVGGGS